ncbi:MAG: recombinase RecT [Nanoarchaeota archaeon]|nr:recombinase RecT [Nanoarchaeota archaeon]
MKDKSLIITELKDYDKVQVEAFANYCYKLLIEKDKKSGKDKNWWMKDRSEKYLIDCFKKVNAEGLVFDGQHITLQSTGISYDYQAYKNKMFIAYPDTVIDDDLVYKSDVFNFSKNSGRVNYTHDIIDPFSREEKDIIGGYCVIKNRRGEFLTLLSASDIEKHRKVARTDYIWKAWFVEMARKTVIKKACKKHFEDIYQNIINLDNDNNDIDNPLDIELSVKQEIETIESIESLKKYFNDNKDKHTANAKGFNKLISDRKEFLMERDDEN